MVQLTCTLDFSLMQLMPKTLKKESRKFTGMLYVSSTVLNINFVAITAYRK